MAGFYKSVARSGPVLMVKRRHGKHHPGYICPKRAARRLISAYIEPELFASLHELTKQDNTTIQDLLDGACREVVKRAHNSVGRRSSDYDVVGRPEKS
jgi:hypothetical protein